MTEVSVVPDDTMPELIGIVVKSKRRLPAKSIALEGGGGGGGQFVGFGICFAFRFSSCPVDLIAELIPWLWPHALASPLKLVSRFVAAASRFGCPRTRDINL